MNIEWMCLLKAIGTYLFWAAVAVASFVALVWFSMGLEHIEFPKITIPYWVTAAAEIAALVLGVAMAVFLSIVMPIYSLYQSMCP